MKHGISSEQIISKLRKTFSIFGYPVKILTDNDKQFISAEFTQFLKSHNIHHHPVSSYWPRANGEVERFNRTLGKLLQCAKAEGKEWRNELDKFLLQYRTTPHPATGKSPANMLFKHKANNDLPSIIQQNTNIQQKQINQKDQMYKMKFKSHADNHRNLKSVEYKVGEEVLIQNMNRKNKSEPFYETKPYQVIDVNYHKLKLQGNKTCYRNKAHVKKYIRPQSKPGTPNHTDKSSHQYTTDEHTNTQIPSIIIQNDPTEEHELIDSDDEDTMPYDLSDDESETATATEISETETLYSDLDTDNIPNETTQKPSRHRRLPSRYKDFDMD